MKDKPRYYRRDGTPYEMEEWAKDLKNPDYKRVALSLLPNGCRVSTVWLGLDHQDEEEGPPLIFETMVFPKGSYGDLDCIRYSTEAEALVGHHEKVQEWIGKESCAERKAPEA